MKKIDVCIIVDAFSTGLSLASDLVHKGYKCINICSSKGIVKNPTANKDVFIEIIIFKSLDHTINSLDKYNVVAVFPGMEGPGLQIADLLCMYYQIEGNDPKTSTVRKNKYDMGNALLKSGIRTIKQIKISEQRKLQEGINYIGKFPMIIKPLTAGNTEDVYICKNECEVKSYFNTIIDKINICSLKNTAVLLQEYIYGEEYIVNTVSKKYKVYVSDIWMYEKERLTVETPVCLSVQLLKLNKDEHEEILQYNEKVLESLGVVNGPAHNEIIVDKSGPVLIESGARLMGGGIKNSVLRQCLEYTQIDATIDYQLNPKVYNKYCHIDYDIKGFLKIVNLISSNKGKIKKINHLDKIRALHSYDSEIFNVSVGDIIQISVDGATCPGHILLFNKNKDVIDEDYKAIQEYQKTMFELIS